MATEALKTLIKQFAARHGVEGLPDLTDPVSPFDEVVFWTPRMPLFRRRKGLGKNFPDDCRKLVRLGRDEYRLGLGRKPHYI
jgi:hypothetical protein